MATLLETASSFEPLPDFELGDAVGEAVAEARGRTTGGVKRQYGQDGDEDEGEDFVGHSSKQFRMDHSGRIFRPQRPPL